MKNKDEKVLVEWHDVYCVLEDLRNAWAKQAYMIEEIYGSDTPVSRAIRICISDINDVYAKILKSK